MTDRIKANIPMPTMSPSILVGVEPWERGIRGMLRRWLHVPTTGPLTEFSIGKLELQPGDLLVLNANRVIPQEAYRRLQEQLRQVVPAGVRSVVIEPGMRFEVLKQADGGQARPPLPPSHEGTNT